MHELIPCRFCFGVTCAVSGTLEPGPRAAAISPHGHNVLPGSLAGQVRSQSPLIDQASKSAASALTNTVTAGLLSGLKRQLPDTSTPRILKFQIGSMSTLTRGDGIRALFRNEQYRFLPQLQNCCGHLKHQWARSLQLRDGFEFLLRTPPRTVEAPSGCA